jgi:hypothetical protein
MTVNTCINYKRGKLKTCPSVDRIFGLIDRLFRYSISVIQSRHVDCITKESQIAHIHG